MITIIIVARKKIRVMERIIKETIYMILRLYNQTLINNKAIFSNNTVI